MAPLEIENPIVTNCRAKSAGVVGYWILKVESKTELSVHVLCSERCLSFTPTNTALLDESTTVFVTSFQRQLDIPSHSNDKTVRLRERLLAEESKDHIFNLSFEKDFLISVLLTLTTKRSEISAY